MINGLDTKTNDSFGSILKYWKYSKCFLGSTKVRLRLWKGGIMLHAWEGTSSTFPTSPNKPLEHFHTELNTNYSK